MSSNTEKILSLAKKQGMLRVHDLTKRNIHPEYLRRLCQKGILIKLGKGLYALENADFSVHVGMAQIAKKIPNCVICLLSSLRFHELGTQNPSEIWIAIDRSSATPRIEYPPLRVARFSGKAMTEGIEHHKIEGVKVKIFNPAKTIADCFKYRNKIGIDVAIEALRDCLKKRLCTIDQLWHYAQICRVANIMRPYLEAIS